VGVPSVREQYIHRLGRTGREGKEGVGILLLSPWEEYFLDVFVTFILFQSDYVKAFKNNWKMKCNFV